MKQSKTAIKFLLILIMGAITNHSYGQIKSEKMKLKTVEYEVIVNVTPEKAWEVFVNYGNVGNIHSGVQKSTSLNESGNEAVIGCERECILPNGKKTILVRERIVDISKGNYYKYEVYEWERFPLKKMFVTYGVKTNSKGETIIYQKNEFRLKPKLLTGLMKGKMRNGARESLIAYKHYMETGEENTDMTILKKKYENL